MGEIEVSVIVAASSADYERLPVQVGQLANQRTQRNYEILVADNSGSLVPEALSGSSVRVVDASQVAGAGYARNCAVEAALGHKLLFCDADDLVGPGWVEAHASALDTVPFTAGGFVSVNAADYGEALVQRANEGPRPTGRAGILRHHERVPFATTANMGVRREQFEAVGGFRVNYLRSQDVAFSLDLRRIGIEPTPISDATVIKLEHKLGAADRSTIERRAGAARVMLARDFGVGPPPVEVALRGAARLVRSVAQSNPRRPWRWERAHLWGILSETTTRSAWKSTSPSGQRSRSAAP